MAYLDDNENQLDDDSRRMFKWIFGVAAALMVIMLFYGMGRNVGLW